MDGAAGFPCENIVEEIWQPPVRATGSNINSGV